MACRGLAIAVLQSPAERFEISGAFLSRMDLAQLGLPRPAIDGVFRCCAVVALPGLRTSAHSASRTTRRTSRGAHVPRRPGPSVLIVNRKSWV